MDKSRPLLRTYFDAARKDPGISETEVRGVLAGRRWRGVGESTAPTGRRSRVVGGLGLLLLLALGAGFLLTLPETSEQPNLARVSDRGSSSRDTRSTVGGETIASTPGATTIDTLLQNNIKDTNAMKATTISKIAAGVMAAATMVNTTTAQTTQPRGERGSGKRSVEVKVDEKLAPLMKQLAADVGKSAADYWVGNLNDYKRIIDRTLSEQDLAALNRLRVRWSIMIDSVAKGNGPVSVDSEIDSDPDGKNSIKLKLGVDARNGGAMQLFELHGAAKEIGGRYRSDLDRLGDRVLEDVRVFIGMMKEETTRFVEQHRAELEQSEQGRKLIAMHSKADNGLAKLDDPQGQMAMKMAYAFAIEPLIMLYDGADLGLFLQQAGPLTSAVTGMELPGESVLKQNVPNPAMTSTTVSYSLTEPSSSTVVRLYDAQGAIVQQIDQGSRDAGQHTVGLDVSKLAAGTYIYHLTIQTAKGSQVFSKAMQVAR